MESYEFIYNERLRIYLPELHLYWEQYSEQERADILMEWEQIRGRIPDRIKDFESIIIKKQEQLNKEEDFIASCDLNFQISELASCINDLHLWYRLNQEFTAGKSHQ